ncbi:uncharacterized protein PAC_17038 [Phialocephala subalpina]|uniref:Uncharacterized protein n=1 Tax=Phialocephala subalpina TaxID=576137 RepID=A0A1L7XQ34_9HELO|nr:uncharacterized protein PAC_17038 [Phialocephala subalpina]
MMASCGTGACEDLTARPLKEHARPYIQDKSHTEEDPQESEHTEDGEARKDPADGEVTKKNKKKRRRNRKKKVKSLATEDNESTNPPTAIALLDAEKNTPKSINTFHSTTIPPDPLYNPNYSLPNKHGGQEWIRRTPEEGSRSCDGGEAKANKKELRELMGKMAEGKNTIEKLSQEITSLRDARKEDSKEIAMLTEHMK